jgi:hypothetical protein
MKPTSLIKSIAFAALLLAPLDGQHALGKAATMLGDAELAVVPGDKPTPAEKRLMELLVERVKDRSGIALATSPDKAKVRVIIGTAESNEKTEAFAATQKGSTDCQPWPTGGFWKVAKPARVNGSNRLRRSASPADDGLRPRRCQKEPPPASSMSGTDRSRPHPTTSKSSNRTPNRTKVSS